MSINKKRKKYITYLIIALIVIAAIVAYTQIRKKSRMPEWRTETPSRGTIREVVTATGSLNPYVLVEVGTEVSGTIKTIYKDFNDPVRKGDLLAKLDTEILLTGLESAQADVNKATISRDEAQMEYDISKDLFDRDMASEYEKQKKYYALLQARQNLSNAQLRLQTAQKNLNNATIRSPIDGVIVARNVNEGQTVAASFSSPTLFTIANNLDKMQISANVDEADIGKIEVGMLVEFSVDAYPGEDFAGSVQQIRLNSVVEQNVVSYSVIIDAANPEHKLLPGMTSNVTIIVQSKDDAMRVPAMATRFSPSKELWELFGLEWEEGLVTNARKKAMETAMARPKAADERPTGNPGNTEKGNNPGAAVEAGAGANRPSKQPPNPGMGSNPGGGRTSASMVWILQDGEPELIMLRTGVSDGAYLEVVSELDPDTQIITGVNYKDPSQAVGNSALGGPGMRF
ncbi:MAG: efflux RND transporter periplasmic adaptor subunit [Candidatus Syntrophosphaera sp.]